MPERRIFAALALSGALLAGCGDSEGIKEGSRDQDAWRYRNLMQAVSKNVARRVGDTSYYEMRAGGACYAVSVVPNMELSREVLERLHDVIAQDAGSSHVASLKDPEECKRVRS